mmetsp:Transcript_29895/g.72222  ORF Transcript_29895/g.72222 Transcript_29895/m.72222 type:complete len:272 (-) Transcript_29895:106-921(-)
MAAGSRTNRIERQKHQHDTKIIPHPSRESHLPIPALVARHDVIVVVTSRQYRTVVRRGRGAVECLVGGEEDRAEAFAHFLLMTMMGGGGHRCGCWGFFRRVVAFGNVIIEQMRGGRGRGGPVGTVRGGRDIIAADGSCHGTTLLDFFPGDDAPLSGLVSGHSDGIFRSGERTLERSTESSSMSAGAAALGGHGDVHGGGEIQATIPRHGRDDDRRRGRTGGCDGDVTNNNAHDLQCCRASPESRWVAGCCRCYASSHLVEVKYRKKHSGYL